MQIKTVTRYYYTSIKMDNKGMAVPASGTAGTLIHRWWEYKIVLRETTCLFLIKLNMTPLLSIYFREVNLTFSPKPAHKCFYQLYL